MSGCLPQSGPDSVALSGLPSMMLPRELSRVVLLLAASVATIFAHAVSGQDAPPRSICFVASRHELGSAGYRFLVEPRFKQELETRGWRVGYATLAALTEERLARFNVVVLQQHPDVERFGLRDMFDKACAELLQYARQGGGLFVFGDLHRGRIVGNLNRLLAPLGAEMLYQVIEEQDDRKTRPLSNYRAVRAFLADGITSCPITDGVRTLWYPQFAQTTATFRVDANWTIAIRAGLTARSRRLAEDARSSEQPIYAQSPPLAACRSWGTGRVVLFSSHSSWYTLNPYHVMWDGGFFLNRGDARTFLLKSFEWLAEPSLRTGAYGGFSPDEQAQLFDISPRLQETVRETVTRQLNGRLRSAVIGIRTRHSDGNFGVTEFCQTAKEMGLNCLVFTETQSCLNEKRWQSLVDDCRRNSDGAFLAIPGVRFRGRESGNDGLLFNLRKPWSELPWNAPGFDTFIRLGCKNGWLANQAQVAPGANPLPYYNQGAVNCHTLFTYAPGDDGRLELVDDSSRAFVESNVSGWRLAPIVVHDIRAPAQLRESADTFRTYFYSSRWDAGIIEQPVNLLNTMVSNGPRIEWLSLNEPGAWMALEERRITIRMRVVSDVPLREVKVLFGGRLLRCLRPDRPVVEQTICFVSNESRDVHLQVTDANGGTAFAKALPAYRVL